MNELASLQTPRLLFYLLNVDFSLQDRMEGKENSCSHSLLCSLPQKKREHCEETLPWNCTYGLY